MTEKRDAEPPSEYTYAVGAGLGLLGGAIAGLVAELERVQFFAAILIGIGIGLLGAFAVKQLRP